MAMSLPAPAFFATIMQSSPMPPVPMTTTSSPMRISLFWTTPFQAPESGSVRAALSNEMLAGL
jgi:hypothetical protein